MTMGGALRKVQQGSEFLFGEVGMSHRFTVSIDKSTYDLGNWSKAAGLTVSWELCRYQVGDDTMHWVCPGNAKYQNISLSRAACSDSQTVQEWLGATVRKGKPLSGAVSMLDWTGMTVIEWTLSYFFPISWKITDFDAGGSKPALETLELVHTGFVEDIMYGKATGAK